MSSVVNYIVALAIFRMPPLELMYVDMPSIIDVSILTVPYEYKWILLKEWNSLDDIFKET